MCFFFESLIIPNCSAGFRPYEIILFYFEHFVFCFYPWGFEPGTQFQGIQEYGFIKERHSKKYVEPLMLGTAPPPNNFDYFQGAISNESLSIASPRFDFVFIRGKISKLYIH